MKKKKEASEKINIISKTKTTGQSNNKNKN